MPVLMDETLRRRWRWLHWLICFKGGRAEVSHGHPTADLLVHRGLVNRTGKWLTVTDEGVAFYVKYGGKVPAYIELPKKEACQ